MADQTIASNKFHKTKIAYGGELDKINNWIENYDVAGADIRAGFVVVFETDGDVDIPASGEQIGGVVLGYANIGQVKQNYSLGVTVGQTDSNGDDVKLDVLNPRLSQGRIKCQMVLSRSTSTAAAVGKNTQLFAEAGSGKLTYTYPGASTAAKTYVGTLADDLASGTADAVVGVWV